MFRQAHIYSVWVSGMVQVTKQNVKWWNQNFNQIVHAHIFIKFVNLYKFVTEIWITNI